MSIYPRNLSAFLNRLSGYNKSNVKMNVLGSDTASSGDTIQVELPTNSIVDLSSLAWSFQAIYNAQENTEVYGLPTEAEDVIQRLAVEVNGQTLVNIQNYNTLFHLLLNMSATEDYQRQRLINQSVSTCVQLTEGGDGGAGTLAARTRDHVIDSWLGFIGTAKPQFIDTSLLGNVRITITLANGDIMGGSVATAPTNRGFTIQAGQFFSCDVISISDGVYDAMVDQRLASGAPIEVPFKNYFSFSGNPNTMDQTLAFNVASQSIDRLWGTARDARYARNTRPEVVLATPTITSVGGEVLAAGKASAPYFKFQSCQGKDFRFQINNTQYPNYTSNKAGVWWQQTKNALGEQGNMLSGSVPVSIPHYHDHHFAFVQSLEHKTDGDERYVSGIDTRGAAASCQFTSTAGGVGTAIDGAAGARVDVFAECTSSLMIMANKVIEVRQ